MIYEFYAAIAAVIAVLYSTVSRFIQGKLGNKHEMKAHQDEMKKLSKDYEDAKKRNDSRKMDEVMQKQMEMLPKMNGLMMGSFKAMIPVLLILFVLWQFFNATDPSLKDDVAFSLNDDGAGCDARAGDGILSGCHPIQGEKGTWAVSVKAHESIFGIYDDVASEKYALFSVGSAVFDNNSYYRNQKGNMNISIDKGAYALGEEIKVYAINAGKPKGVTATLNSGTSFYVDLPFSIPILNVQRIHESYWWFIFVSFVSSPIISYTVTKFEKGREEDGKKKEKLKADKE